MNVTSRFSDYLRRGSLFGPIAAENSIVSGSDLETAAGEDGAVDDASGVTVSPSSIATIICATLLCIYALYLGRTLFVPIATGLFAYLAVRPLVRALRDFGVPSTPAAVLISVAAILSVGIAFYLLSGPFTSLINEAPETVRNAKHKLAFIFDRLESLNKMTEEDGLNATSAGEEKQSPVLVQIQQPAWLASAPLLSSTGNVLSGLAVSAVLCFFLMASGDGLLNSIISVMPSFRSKRRIVETVQSVQDALSRYLALVTLINIGLGISVALVTWMLGVTSPLMWGVIAMVLNYIPVVGATIGIVSLFLVSLMQFDNLTMAFIAAGAFATLTTIEGQFITPSILGRSMEMSPVMVFLSLVIWGWLWGLMGVFLAVPILIAGTMICERLDRLSAFSSVLSGSPINRTANAETNGDAVTELPQIPASQ